jgi:hypothetical protein
MSQQQQSEQGIKPNRVPQNMEAAAQLIRGRNTTDIFITVVTPMILVVMLMYFDIISLTVVVACLVGLLAVNYLLYKILPTDASMTYWIMSIVGYLRTPKVMLKHDSGVDADDINIEFIEENTGGRDPTAGGMFDFIAVDEKTTDLTLVDEIDVDSGVVKLRDGSFVAGIKVSGMGMLLADRDMRMDATQKFKQALNTLDYPIMMRATSRQYDISSIIDRYEDRLEDKDMQSRPIMNRVMSNKKQFIQQEIKPLGTNNREYYIMVRAEYGDQDVGAGPFSLDFISPNSPVGKFLRDNGLGGGDSGETVEDELITTVRKRANDISKAMTRNNSLDTRMLTGGEVSDTLRYYWRRESVQETDWQPAEPVSATREQIAEAEDMGSGGIDVEV